MQKKILLITLVLIVLYSCQKGNAQNEELTFPTIPNSENSEKLNQYRIIQFGHYPQNNEENTAIEWIILTIENDKCLLLSRYLISARPWDVSGTNLTYDNSSIRKWLNEDFLSVAFSNSESDNIIPTELDNSEQLGYNVSAGNNTTDKVFLLSVREFETYIKNSVFNTSSPTALAKKEGAYTNKLNNAAWWLRSPGMQRNSPAYLNSNGEIGSRAHAATENIIGIRPAIWVTIQSFR